MAHDLLEFATQLAQETGQMLLERFHSGRQKALLKADQSIVTEADFASDQLITETIHSRFPDDMIISEERQVDIPAVNAAPSSAIWIIDPLDGTTNFSLGLHFWGVLLARLIDGYPELCVMYFPVVNEIYWAQKNLGAYLNNNRIRVIPPDPERPFSFFACCSRTHRKYHVQIPYKTRIFGSASYTFCTVARGAAVIGFEATPKIWDIAGAWLLLQEAGGVIRSLDDSHPFPLQFTQEHIQRYYPTLAAATPELASRASQQLKPRP